MDVCLKDREDVCGAAEDAIRHTRKGDVLICWEHKHLQLIAQAMGVDNAPAYPSGRFDLIWVVPRPFEKITDIRSQHVPGLDDPLLPRKDKATKGDL